MPVTLENRTARPVLVVLPTGASLRLGPGEVSEGLDEVQVHASEKIGKLAARGVLAVHEGSATTSQPKPKRQPTKGTAKRAAPRTAKAEKAADEK